MASNNGAGNGATKERRELADEVASWKEGIIKKPEYEAFERSQFFGRVNASGFTDPVNAARLNLGKHRGHVCVFGHTCAKLFIPLLDIRPSSVAWFNEHGKALQVLMAPVDELRGNYQKAVRAFKEKNRKKSDAEIASLMAQDLSIKALRDAYAGDPAGKTAAARAGAKGTAEANAVYKAYLKAFVWSDVMLVDTWFNSELAFVALDPTLREGHPAPDLVHGATSFNMATSVIFGDQPKVGLLGPRNIGESERYKGSTFATSTQDGKVVFVAINSPGNTLRMAYAAYREPIKSSPTGDTVSGMAFIVATANDKGLVVSNDRHQPYVASGAAKPKPTEEAKTTATAS